MSRLVVGFAAVCVACVPADPPRESQDAGAPRSEAAAPEAKPRSPQPQRAARSAPTPAPVAKPGQPPPGPRLLSPFHDSFERAQLGADYYVTSPAWKLRGGRLCAQGARNRPAWLNRRLPVNARIELDAESQSSDGDLKVEAWGSGRSSAKGVSYSDASSYLFIFGGWRNRLHVLARLDEHGQDRLALSVDPAGKDPRTRPVQPNKSYRFKIERRDGRTVRWWVNQIELHKLEDPAPLKGPGHEYFGFNDWDVPVCFDNLVITPLD